MNHRSAILKNIFTFVTIYVAFSFHIAFADEKKAKIKNVGLTGLFENSVGDPYITTEYLLPVDRNVHKVEFTYGTKKYLIPFLATVVKTKLEKDGKYITEKVKIEYFSMALSDFYQNDAILKFKGYDKNTNVLQIDKVFNYRKADFNSSGWVLQNTEYPANEVTFTSKNYGEDKGVTDRAFFIIHYSYPVTEP